MQLATSCLDRRLKQSSWGFSPAAEFNFLAAVMFGLPSALRSEWVPDLGCSAYLIGFVLLCSTLQSEA